MAHSILLVALYLVVLANLKGIFLDSLGGMYLRFAFPRHVRLVQVILRRFRTRLLARVSIPSLVNRKTSMD